MATVDPAVEPMLEVEEIPEEGIDLEEWRRRREQGIPAITPSGLRVRVRRVSVIDLAEQGEIPAELAPAVAEFLRGGRDPEQRDLDYRITAARMVNMVCRAAIVGPAGLDPVELPYNDRESIFAWANSLTGRLKFFRQ